MLSAWDDEKWGLVVEPQTSLWPLKPIERQQGKSQGRQNNINKYKYK